MRNCVFIILLIIISNKLIAQVNISLEKVQQEGLTNYIIKCIQQDTNGFIWFGTEEGLFRYDGYSFKPFKNFPGDSLTLINNNIEFLFPGNDKLWIGSRGGLSCVDINTNKVQNFSPGELLTVYAIVPENDSIFWIGSSIGLFQFNKKRDKWKRITAVDKNVFIRSLCDDRRHHLYITSHTGFYCYDEIKQTCKHYAIPCGSNKDPSFQIVHRSFLDYSGNVWMSSWRAGLIEFDPRTEKIKEWLYNKNDSISSQPYIRAYDIVKNKDGNIWLANSEKGLTIFNPVSHNINNYPIKWNNEEKSIDKALAIFEDRSGIWWVGTENGIYKYDPHMIHLSETDFFLKSNMGVLKSQLSPLCMLKDKDGLWWIGGYEGLYLLDTSTGILHDYTLQAGIPGSMIITSIVQDSAGTIWLASRGMIIALTKNKKEKKFSLQHVIYTSPEIQSVVTGLYLDHENRIWVGTHNNGIFMFDRYLKKFIPYPYGNAKIESNENEVRCFYEITKDSLLVGGERTGMLLLHTNNGRYDKISWNKKVAMRVDNLTINSVVKMDNSYWIATDFNGLWQSDISFKHVFQYSTYYGLPSMNISSMMPDKRNHLWLLTEGGLVDFQPIKDEAAPVIDQAIIYDEKDGIKSSSDLSSIIKDGSENIVISDMGCIHVLNPFRAVRNSVPPPVIITSFKIFDKEHEFKSNKPVVLNYNENYFSFEYVALNYTQPSLNMYAYKMEGLDTQWNEVDTRRYVSYAGLKEGTYTFEVKAGNNEGIWNNLPAAITLIIKPPFWHTWWFYSLIAIGITGLLYSFYLMKLNQLKAKYQLRNKIARDLHDDIGSTLSGINIFSKLALQKMQTDQPASSKLLEKISDRSKKTMDALSDIVWSINTKNDDMDNVLAKMQEYISETLEGNNINYNFEIDASVRDTQLDMQLRKELYLIFKEAVYNASKYAQCDFVNIVLRRKKNTCTLIIQDNGKGFDIATITPGNGIHNMRQRAAKMNAQISMQSEINKGTIISLEFRIT